MPAANRVVVMTAPAKLLTLVLPESAEDVVQGELRALGVVGWTATTARGHGVHGERPSTWYGNNVRLEIVASPELVARVLDRVERTLKPTPIVAWVLDAQVHPADRIARA